MQYQLLVVALAALTTARRVKVPFPVCGSRVAACCQEDILKRGDLDSRTVILPTDVNCQNAGAPTNIKKFEASCAASGRTAQCCETLIDNIGSDCYEL